jgi:hypothetical protein
MPALKTGATSLMIQSDFRPGAALPGGSLSFTSQLRDFSSYAQTNGYTFQLTVRSLTLLSGPLQQAVSLGNITLLRTLP